MFVVLYFLFVTVPGSVSHGRQLNSQRVALTVHTVAPDAASERHQNSLSNLYDVGYFGHFSCGSSSCAMKMFHEGPFEKELCFRRTYITSPLSPHGRSPLCVAVWISYRGCGSSYEGVKRIWTNSFFSPNKSTHRHKTA